MEAERLNENYESNTNLPIIPVAYANLIFSSTDGKLPIKNTHTRAFIQNVLIKFLIIQYMDHL